MKVMIFGATGMVGQGVMRGCLLDDDVEVVQTVGRGTTGIKDTKLREVMHADLWNLSAIESELRGFDACFFCLGVSAGRMKEAEYTRMTYDLTMAAAETLARLNPAMTFVYVSGTGTDSTEKGRSMWARVKGRTENALLRLPFRAYMFRPGLIVPMHGIKSRTKWYRVMYQVTTPILPAMRKMFPRQVLTTEEIGRAMLLVAKKGAPKRVLETADIRAVLSS